VTGTEREYVVGWIKRGPTGIIGTNRKDAVETVNRLLADLAEGTLRRQDRDGTIDLRQWLGDRQPRLVTEQAWRLIDAAERSAGAASGRPRVKLCTLEDLLDAAFSAARTD
jgi:ferredoxin--NADP+ reductase